MLSIEQAVIGEKAIRSDTASNNVHILPNDSVQSVPQKKKITNHKSFVSTPLRGWGFSRLRRWGESNSFRTLLLETRPDSHLDPLTKTRETCPRRLIFQNFGMGRALTWVPPDLRYLDFLGSGGTESHPLILLGCLLKVFLGKSSCADVCL